MAFCVGRAKNCKLPNSLKDVTLLLKLSDIKEKIQKFWKKSAPEETFFVDLAPTDKADEKGVYSKALAYATSNPNITNIALTGPYGSGKSSIIKTFLKGYGKPTLNISLASFVKEGEKGEAEVSKQEIERSILQQMLYGSDSDRLPLSRFKRIQSPGKWAIVVPAYIVAGIFSLYHMFNKHAEIYSGAYFLPYAASNWFNFVCFVTGTMFIWSVFHHIYVRSMGISLKSISLKDIEITSDLAKEESILNRHLDEIVYFFQSTNYELVVVEDLDRFNEPDIFVNLREINSLINANSGVKKTVRFLYALRDNMFDSADRTKFFEFIVPVIPIINASNSIDKVLEHGKRIQIDNRLNSQFLKEVSRYLNDLRLIQNIFNEYVVYVRNLETDGESVLDVNKLLAVLIYKNIMPGDFEDLHAGKGMLASILSRHDDLIMKAEARYKAQVNEIEAQIAQSDEQLPADLHELRSIYILAMLKRFPDNYTALDFEGHNNVNLRDISSHPLVDDMINAPYINARWPHAGQIQRVNLSGLQDEVNSQKSYDKRREEIERKAEEFREASSKTVRDLRSKIASVRLSKFNEIIRADPRGADELFAVFADNKELARYLVFEGFLDDTYYQYTSLFHSGRLSPNDNKFLIQIRGFINPDPDFQIDNPKEVIAAMRDDDFLQSYALNKTLVDTLFADQVGNGERISKLLGFLASNFDQTRAFFRTYYERGAHVGDFLAALVTRWPGFIAAATASADNMAHVAQMIAKLPKQCLADVSAKDPTLSAFVASHLSSVLAEGVEFDLARLADIQPQVEDLSSIEAHPTVFRLLVDRGLYEISKGNIEVLFRAGLGATDLDDLKVKHYTAVLNSGNAPLIRKVHGNFDHYFSTILMQIETNIGEDGSTLIDLMAHDEIALDQLTSFITRQTAVLPSLDRVPPRMHPALFNNERIEATWENCIAFLSREGFEEDALTAFLENENVFRILSSVGIPAGDPAKPLRDFIFNNDHIDGVKYRRYIRMLPDKFKNFPESFDSDRLESIIEEMKVSYNVDSHARLDDFYDLQLLFVAKNIDDYFLYEQEVALDDDFRERLLAMGISDELKVRLILSMDLSNLESFPNRSAAIGPIFDRVDVDISNLSSGALQAIITHTKSSSVQISLFNKYENRLSDDEVRATMQSLPDPFCDIKPGWRRPTIKSTPVNIQFLTWLERRNLISSWKETIFDELRVHPRQK